MYTIAGATFGIFSDQNCSNQIGTLTTNENGETNEVEVTAGTVYIAFPFVTISFAVVRSEEHTCRVRSPQSESDILNM